MTGFQGTLLGKLEELDVRYTETADRMNDPAVAADAAQIVALAKEHARLAKIVEPYRRYRKLLADRDEAGLQTLLGSAANYALARHSMGSAWKALSGTCICCAVKRTRTAIMWDWPTTFTTG